AMIALRVGVLDRPVENVGDGLEAAVRVVGRSLRLTGAVRHGSHPVEEEKRIEVIEAGGGKRPSDHHPFAFELRRGVYDFYDRAGSHDHPIQQRGIPGGTVLVSHLALCTYAPMPLCTPALTPPREV